LPDRTTRALHAKWPLTSGKVDSNVPPVQSIRGVDRTVSGVSILFVPSFFGKRMDRKSPPL